jgi:hypothetical protein
LSELCNENRSNETNRWKYNLCLETMMVKISQEKCSLNVIGKTIPPPGRVPWACSGHAKIVKETKDSKCPMIKPVKNPLSIDLLSILECDFFNHTTHQIIINKLPTKIEIH